MTAPTEKALREALAGLLDLLQRVEAGFPPPYEIRRAHEDRARALLAAAPEAPDEGRPDALRLLEAMAQAQTNPVRALALRQAADILRGLSEPYVLNPVAAPASPGPRPPCDKSDLRTKERCTGRLDHRGICTFQCEGCDGSVCARGYHHNEAAFPDPEGERATRVFWSVSSDQERFYGKFATREEAIKEAPAELGQLQPGDTFWIATGSLYEVSGLRVDDLFERMAEDAGEECGEVAEDWQPAPDKQCEREVLAAVMRCLVRQGEVPGFWTVDTGSIEKHHAPASPPSPAPEAAPCPVPRCRAGMLLTMDGRESISCPVCDKTLTREGYQSLVALHAGAPASPSEHGGADKEGQR